MFIPLRRLLISVIGITAGGCFGAPHFEPSVEPLATRNSRARCEEVMQRREPVASMKALVDAEFSRKDEGAQFRYALVSREESSLRVDMLPPEGAVTLAILVVHDGVSTLINSQEKTYTAGFDEKQLVQKFFGLEGVSKSIVIGLLSGVVPELFCQDVVAYDEDADSVVLLDAPSHTAWHVTPKGLVRGVEILDDRNRMVRLRAKVQEVSAEGLPTIAVALYAPYEVQGLLTATKLTFNQPIKPALFNVEVPSDYQQVD
jgi:hypothetical protein